MPSMVEVGPYEYEYRHKLAVDEYITDSFTPNNKVRFHTIFNNSYRGSVSALQEQHRTLNIVSIFTPIS